MFFYYFIAGLHVIVCVILILVVLLQSGKGADLAGAFGGGATQTAFGSRGPASFLSKLTTGAAIVFMATSLGLSLIGGSTGTSSVLDQTKGGAVPAPKAPTTQQQPVAAPSPEEIKRQQEEIEKRQGETPEAAPTKSQPPAAESPKKP